MPNSTITDKMTNITTGTNPENVSTLKSSSIVETREGHNISTQTTESQLTTITQPSVRRTKTKRMICAHEGCNKKILPVNEILGKCRCAKTFCPSHRMPETHNCKHEFILNETEFIASNKCVATKI